MSARHERDDECDPIPPRPYQPDPETNTFLSKWRPYMGWTYIAICLMDFIIGPACYAWLAWYTKNGFGEWAPLTLGGGGVFHLAMGTVLGVTSWTRGQEKIARMDREMYYEVEERRYSSRVQSRLDRFKKPEGDSAD